MKRAYNGLEKRVLNHHSQFRSSTNETFDRISSPYRSQSEHVIANILEKNDIRFDYEDELHVPKKHTGASDRVWHPDFHLRASGVIVEYAGMSDDEEYTKGVERKKEVYEQMGIAVVWLYPADLWEPTADHRHGKLREDVNENVLKKIDQVVRKNKRNADSWYCKTVMPTCTFREGIETMQRHAPT